MTTVGPCPGVLETWRELREKDNREGDQSAFVFGRPLLREVKLSERVHKVLHLLLHTPVREASADLGMRRHPSLKPLELLSNALAAARVELENGPKIVRDVERIRGVEAIGVEGPAREDFSQVVTELRQAGEEERDEGGRFANIFTSLSVASAVVAVGRPVEGLALA